MQNLVLLPINATQVVVERGEEQGRKVLQLAGRCWKVLPNSQACSLCQTACVCASVSVSVWECICTLFLHKMPQGVKLNN